MITVSDNDTDKLISLKPTYEKLKDILVRRNRLTKLDYLANKELTTAINLVKINDTQISSAEDCNTVLCMIELYSQRKKCASFWQELITENGGIAFYELDNDEPEIVAKDWIPEINKHLKWYSDAFSELDRELLSVGIDVKNIIFINRSDNGVQRTEKIISATKTTVPDIIRICQCCAEIKEIENRIDEMAGVLRSQNRQASSACQEMLSALLSKDADKYRVTYNTLSELFDKYNLQASRREYLRRIETVAPDWANAIRNRQGVHGGFTVPEDIEEAWKWKQLSSIISEIVKVPYDQLQNRSVQLSHKYRDLTSRYAEKMAWYHLLERTENDIDMRQALNGWRQTVRKIGKGTGKTAPKYKAQARALMAKCQNAVSAWIMPMGKVIESLDPKENQFDVVIVDEASQSDVTSLGIMYLGKKYIIVGDDKQVSPMGIGSDTAKIDAIERMYIKGVIPNSHLYGSTSSLYDIAATTYQPLMLREHFRCVPEIIGFSNMLSYDYKIKPLRDPSSNDLLPDIVNYRVEKGERFGRVNREEAKSIVALMKACLKQPEYEGKTFGAISMLGDEQARLINQLVIKYIEPRDIEERRILVGNPAHFQGDERDVIFLSLVDSNDKEGPLTLQEYGPGESIRKRYNVASSRAKDQLWVVHSLDSSRDLKPNDIRKRLIDYAKDPEAFENVRTEIENKADSVFETSVAMSLVTRGYKIEQQRQVGAYRLDIVAEGENARVAIECDGERYHSGDAKIREDMERQTILERAGWTFIRIRGSEYFSDPDRTIERVMKELHEYGVDPQGSISVTEHSTDLLDRIKYAAHEIYNEFDEPQIPSFATILEAYKN